MKIYLLADGWLGKAAHLEWAQLQNLSHDGHRVYQLPMIEDEPGADVCLIAGWKKILTPRQLRSFNCPTILNLHPSALPLYRGPRPLIRQQADRVTRSALTIHHAIPEVDAGPIVVQRFFDWPPGAPLDTIGDIIRSILPSTIDAALSYLEPTPL